MKTSNLLLSAVFLVGCTKATTPNVNVTVPITQKTEEVVSAPVDKEDPYLEEVQEIKKLKDYPAVPLLKGSPSTEDGVLISPRNAAEAALNAAEAERLRTENQVLVRTHALELSLHSSYQKILENENEKLKKKSWWDKHGSTTLFGVGLTTGVALSLAIFKLSVQVSMKNN